MSNAYHVLVTAVTSNDVDLYALVGEHVDEEYVDDRDDSETVVTDVEVETAARVRDELAAEGVQATVVNDDGTPVPTPESLADGRLPVALHRRVGLERRQFFAGDDDDEARWFVDGERVAAGESFTYEWTEPGSHELVVEFDGRRVRREVVAGLDTGVDASELRDALFVVVAKLRGKLYFVPVPGDSEPTDTSDRRKRATAQHERGEPASFDFAGRQNDVWTNDVLRRPLLAYERVPEGVYAVHDDVLYYLGAADGVADHVSALKDALAHDADADRVSDARPSAVFRAVTDLAAAFDPSDTGLGERRFLPRADDGDGGAFERFLTENVGGLYGPFEDHAAAFGVDPASERVGVMFGYNTQNFTFSTRFADEGLGISRQYSNMLGFGRGAAAIGDGRGDLDGFGVGGGRGRGGSSGFGLNGDGGLGRESLFDAFGFGRSGGDGEDSGSGGGRLPGRSMLDDGEGFGLGFGLGTGQGTMMDGWSGIVGNAEPGEHTEHGQVTRVDENADGSRTVYVENTDPDSDTPGAIYFGVPKSDDDTEPSGGDGGQPDDTGTDGTEPDDTGTDGTEPDDTGTDGADPDDTEPDDSGTDGTEPDDGAGGDDGADPGDTDEVGMTPTPNGPGGGTGGGELPEGFSIGGMSGGCRGGGYTDPGTDGTGGGDRGGYGAFLGVVCPMGDEPTAGLTQPGPDQRSRPPVEIDEAQLIRELLGQLTQPGMGQTVMGSDDQLTVDGGGSSFVVGVGQTVDAAAEGDAVVGRDDEPLTADGGRQPTEMRSLTFRIADGGAAARTGMAAVERFTGTMDGQAVSGLFGFAGPAPPGDATRALPVVSDDPTAAVRDLRSTVTKLGAHVERLLAERDD